MKKQSFLSAILAAVLLIFTGCDSKDNVNVSMILVPEGTLNISTINDLEDASRIIGKRLSAYGIKDENVIMEVLSDRIQLSLNGIDSAGLDIITGILTTRGKTGFWETYDNPEMFSYLIDANNRSKGMDFGFDITPAVIEAADSLPELLQIDQQSDSVANAERLQFSIENPLFSILRPMVSNEGQPMPSSLIGLSAAGDTAKVMGVLLNKEISLLFPSGMNFVWSRKPYKYDKSGSLYELHAIKGTWSGDAPFDGSNIVKAEARIARSGDITLNFAMDAEGAARWKRMTAENIDRCIALIIDGYVYSYPRVQNEITGGNTEITGDFSVSEATELAAIFGSGEKALPLKLSIRDMQIEKE